jgi:hypothetical protein
MLTFEKLQTYRRFCGDSDIFGRSMAMGDRDDSGITEEDWQLIDELRMGLALTLSGRAAPEFAASVERRLASVTMDEQSRQLLRDLSQERLDPLAILKK